MAFLMKKMSATAIVIAIAILLVLCCGVVHGTPNTARLLYGCSTTTYVASDPYQLSVDYVLSELLSVTANTPGYNLYTQSPYASSPPAFGHGTCNVVLSAADCVTCITTAYTEIRGLCNGYIGGKVHLGDCTVRYENYSFSEK